VNRITRYALALALGLSVVSTAAFAADPSTDQSANAQYAPPQAQGAQQNQQHPGPWEATPEN
jgi:hypothetical protein